MHKAFFTLVSVIVFFIAIDAVAAKKKVLVIESYHPVLAWTTQCERGIEGVLAPKYELHYFYMDTKRVPPSEFDKKAEMAWERYLKLQPDLVMIGDDNGLRLLGPKFSKTHTPVVFFGINNNPRYYFEQNAIPVNITGVLERTPVVPWLRYLTTIVPNSKAILVLMDSSSTSEAIVDVVFHRRKNIRIDGATSEYKIAKNWSEWKNIVESAKQYDLILMPTFHAVKDQTGALVSVEDVVAWTAAHTPIPVFSNQDYTVSDNGVIGAYVIYGVTHGKQAAEIALEILEKRKSQKFYTIISDTQGRFYFNRHQLDRFRLTLTKEIQEQAVFQ